MNATLLVLAACGASATGGVLLGASVAYRAAFRAATAALESVEPGGASATWEPIAIDDAAAARLLAQIRTALCMSCDTAEAVYLATWPDSDSVTGQELDAWPVCVACARDGQQFGATISELDVRPWP